MEIAYYSLDEISKNNGKDGAQTWIIIKNSVYDVSEYLQKDLHPGGVELIEEWAGKDATRAFDDAGHSGDAKAELKKLKIGELAESDRNKPSTKENKNSSKPAVQTDYNEKHGRSCLSIITCGLMA